MGIFWIMSEENDHLVAISVYDGYGTIATRSSRASQGFRCSLNRARISNRIRISRKPAYHSANLGAGTPSLGFREMSCNVCSLYSGLTTALPFEHRIVRLWRFPNNVA